MKSQSIRRKSSRKSPPKSKVGEERKNTSAIKPIKKMLKKVDKS